jgi:phosphatidylserine/phosphatidylglycerophosphate/cardiolipin synthase-like enzyme
VAIKELIRRLSGLDTARRLGQALWMSIELPLKPDELLWSRALLGEGGDQLLWSALVECGAVDQQGKLRAVGLSRLLCKISGSEPIDATSTVVWTLPRELSEEVGERTYLQAAKSIIDSAKNAIWIVSPFVEAYGVGRLIGVISAALGRGVSVTIVADEVGAVTALAAKALEELRREAAYASGALAIYSVETNGRLLVHSKIILADAESVLIGSANLTDRGLASNLEAGVLLRGPEVADVLHKLRQLVSSSLVRMVVSR